ncbi:MAG: MFS transporter [archaeon YNP-WB-040]|nr:MFS transporter [Candidatus Culexarchaeum yellowstonense]
MGFRDLSRVSLITFILLSLVSLFADMTYEGARSISGAYLEVLSATAVFASLASIGEFLGYIMRFVSGILAGYFKSSKGYWGLTFMGYILNLMVVPLLAFSGQWQMAILLIFLERMGKGLRTPTRDVILSEVTEEIGRGKAFGLHEALDQAGAVLGPLIVSVVLFRSNSYALAFLVLALPAMASILFLLGAYMKYPRVKAAEKAIPLSKSGAVLNDVFWLYTISMSIVAFGFIHWINVSYIFKAENILPDYLISTMYLVAMLVDGLLAFPVGLVYDKIGLVSLLITPVSAALIVPMIFMKSFVSVLFASIFWGVVMGIYESTARAAIADILPPEGRAYGYGVFGLFYGTAWMSGTIAYGYFYQNLTSYLSLFTISIESIALIILLITVKRFKDFRSK